MLSRIKLGLAVACCCLAAGCAQNNTTSPETKPPVVKVSGIAVLPVQIVVEEGEGLPEEGERTLKAGAQVMDSLMRELLAGKPQIHFVPSGKQPVTAGDVETARQIASQQGSNVVLATTLSRFNERVGGEYGVKQPAAVTFSYRLFEVGEGKVLCHGRFDERQQSVMENLFALPKAQSRGLVWLTAQELARDGLREKFAECSYLQGQ